MTLMRPTPGQAMHGHPERAPATGQRPRAGGTCKTDRVCIGCHLPVREAGRTPTQR